MNIPQLLNDFLSLFYPNLCLACGEHLPAPDQIICLTCEYKLPATTYHLEEENPFTERFWGRLQLENGAACYHFVKGGRTQQLIHKLKYKGKREVGARLGMLYGRKLKSSPLFQQIDRIIPVPLHPKKQHKRGFNQSAMFAKGLSEIMDIPWDDRALIRREQTSSQTKKSRIERFENVRQAFAVRRVESLIGKHILLVDDVITTGATLEACGLKILEVPETKLSMATIAIAEM